MKIYIGKSKLHGKGLFALKNIKKGETVFIIKGKRISFLINDKKQADIAGLNWVGIGKNQWVDPIKHCVYFNHSCDPNTIIKGKVTVVAIRDIKKDEEITFDYSLNESDIFWKMKCKCDSKKCRKTIESIQFLPYNIFSKRMHHIPKYYRQILKEFNITNFKDFKHLRDTWIDFIKKN